MATELESNVHIGGVWYGPDYPDNGDVPSGWKPLEEQSPDDDVFTPKPRKPPKPRKDTSDDEDESEDKSGDSDTSDDGPPPTHGTGSGKKAWTDYAEAHGVQVTDDMSREDIVEACRAQDVPVD